MVVIWKDYSLNNRGSITGFIVSRIHCVHVVGGAGVGLRINMDSFPDNNWYWVPVLNSQSLFSVPPCSLL